MTSPDGQWITYTSNELGSTDVFVRPFPQKAGGPRRVSTEGGGWPYAPHPDAQRVLLAAAEAQGAAEARDKVVFNFGFGEYLKKIAPGTK